MMEFSKGKSNKRGKKSLKHQRNHVPSDIPRQQRTLDLNCQSTDKTKHMPVNM